VGETGPPDQVAGCPQAVSPGFPTWSLHPLSLQASGVKVGWSASSASGEFDRMQASELAGASCKVQELAYILLHGFSYFVQDF
jgi:hypothetical protein